MSWTIRRLAELEPTPWRNGRGTTRDVVTVRDATGALLWQASLAELTENAAFSFFPHCDRIFTPVAGEPPPSLSIDGAAFEPRPLLVPVAFPGDVPTLSRIPAPGRAFNAVWDRRAFACGVEVLGSGEREVAGPAVIHCHAGTVDLSGIQLLPGDSAFGEGGFSVSATAILVTVRALT